ncbi:MAG: hemerythrin domain-containing protein, partial [Acidimicrobiales bacterium]|nr:hemerythrin domain-containing protein [Acidimicrobiales bacterium]
MGENALDVLIREHEDMNAVFARVRDPEADRSRAWQDAVRQVTTHVAVERTFIYPLVKRRRLGSEHLTEDLRHDYAQMEHLLVLTERRKINSPDMPDLVTGVLEAFEAHQDRCAQVLIPAMRDRLGDAEMEDLGTKMRGAENVILSHPHPHLLALGPVY